MARWVQHTAAATLALLLIAGGAGSAAAAEENTRDDAMAIATFAGGCFWCMEPPFERLEGVEEVRAGYTGGQTVDPSYGEVTSGETGHYEAARIVYDPDVVSYETLLEVFWRNVDPTDKYGQFADRGSQYRTAIFYHDEEQRDLAVRSKEELDQSGTFDEPVVTEILPAGPFYDAEEYHQDYYEKNPLRYKMYKEGSGRAGFLEKTWGAEGKYE